MTAKVPPEIRTQVLVLWLRAYSRDNIARTVGIGTGTVSEILKEYIKRDPEFVHLREFVVALKNEVGDIKKLASAIRHLRVLESHNLTEEQIESLIMNAINHCFKKGVSLEKFIEEVDKVSKLADNTGVAIEMLQAYVQDKKRELHALTIDLSSKKTEMDTVSRKYDEKKVKLEDLRKSLANTQTQFIAVLQKENLARALDNVISQFSWERVCRKHLAAEIIEAVNKFYGNIDRFKNHQRASRRNESTMANRRDTRRTGAGWPQREFKIGASDNWTC
jgi:hypothetical protein